MRELSENVMEDREPPAGSDPEEAEAEAAEPKAQPAPPPIAHGEDHPVDPRSVRIARLIAVPLTLAAPLLPVAFITVGWALDGIPTLVYLPLLAVVLSLAAAAVTIAYRFPAARHRHLRYRVDPDGLRIRRGVLWRKTIWISITRVQHTDVSQGPLQRRFDLATLTVHTAGTEGASISLAGLGHGIAVRLSDHLRPERARDAG
jgi:hypothetical protein